MTTTEYDELEELGEKETGFRIDGNTYPIPTLDSFDMDEGQILFDLSGLTIEDFVPLGEEADEDEKEERSKELSRNVKNPAFLRALMTIAYRRGNPKLPMGRVRDVVATANQMGAMADFLRASATRARKAREEHPELPPTKPLEPQRSSDGNSIDSSGSSGNGSDHTSDAPDENLAPTGPIESAISATSGRTESGV